jgi:hypothetical protein
MRGIMANFSVKDSEVYILGFLCISVLFFNFVLIDLCFIFRVENTSFVFPVSILLSYLLALNKFSIRKVNLIILFFVIFIAISLLINSFIIDFSMDGMGYHKDIILEISKKWNPVYQEMVKEKPYRYVYNHYVKGIEFSQYSVYSLIKNIESSKTINFLFLLSSVCFTYLSAKKIFQKQNFSIFFTLFLNANPIVINQIFTFYVDYILYLSFLICLSILILHTFNNELPYIDFLLVMIIVLFVNIKLTSFVFVLSMFIFYFIYLLYVRKMKEVKYMLKLLIVSGILIGIFSWHPFGENLLKKGNPIYPIAGKNKLDVIEHQRPPTLKHDLSIIAAIKSVFYRVNNAPHSWSNGKVNENVEEFKIPFSFKFYEIKYSSIASARLSGFGFWFSGFFVLAIILFIIMCFYLKNDQRNLFILFNLFIFFSIIPYLQGAWWARFIPQLWAFPIFIFFMCYYFGNTKLKIISKISLSLVTIMILVIGGYNYSKTIYNSYEKRKCLSMLKKCFGDEIINIKVLFDSEEFYFKEYGIEVNKITAKEFEKDKQNYYLFKKYYLIKKDGK